MPTEKQPQKDQIKVTDKRIFTAEGEIREEFRNEIKPVEPQFKPAERPEASQPEPPAPSGPGKASAPGREERRVRDEEPPSSGDRRRTIKDKAANPGSAFTDFIEPLIAQGYMSLGMLRNPYSPKPQIDVGAARQMIDIITMLHEKTAGNLSEDEEDFLNTHLGELKLAYVQRTKTI